MAKVFTRTVELLLMMMIVCVPVYYLKHALYNCV
jgi:hypothetical protein